MKRATLRAALAAFGISALVASGGAHAADFLQPSTTKDLTDAMKGEAFATLKYMAYADAARARGNAQLADLFDTIAKVERQDHFAAHAKMAGLVGTDGDNLLDAIKGETYETTTMYPRMAQRAATVGDKQAAQHFREVGGDEARHRDTYQAEVGRLISK